MIRIGCFGWNYRHWRGDFYPDGLPVKRWFEHYATQFDTVEVNASFYRLPEASTFVKWRDRLCPLPWRVRQICRPLFGRSAWRLGRVDACRAVSRTQRLGLF